MVTAGFTPLRASGRPTASPVATPATAAFSPGVRLEQPLKTSEAATGTQNKRARKHRNFILENLTQTPRKNKKEVIRRSPTLKLHRIIILNDLRER
jgi:hypothetical protein